MGLGLSSRILIIASLVLLVMFVVMWRMTQSSTEKPLYTIDSVSESLTGDKAKHTTTLLTNLSTEVYVQHEKSLQWPTIPEYDTMPFSEYLKKRKKLFKAEWISTLYTFLQTLDKSVSPHVNLVFGDYNHRHLVMNWITAALMVLEPPLRNVMVLSLNHSLCDYLMSRTLPLTCITVTADSLFTLHPNNEIDKWRIGLMVRFPVLRLINYWGYDVAAYDSDAVLLHNPQALYSERQQVDVFSSAGTFPPDVSKIWGFTLCGGTIMFRASPAVEALWRHVSAVKGVIGSDQKPLNLGLADMEVRWKETTNSSNICSIQKGWESEGPIKVFVFPQEQFCRRSCCHPNMSHTTLYLVHPKCKKREIETKKDALRKLQAWFLNDKDMF